MSEKTKLVEWRGGLIEFCTTGETQSSPPWWLVRYRGRYWGQRWCYLWLDYAGPPKIFLTRKRAEVAAKAFRKQYGIGDHFGGGPLKVEVVRFDP